MNKKIKVDDAEKRVSELKSRLGAEQPDYHKVVDCVTDMFIQKAEVPEKK